jgi:hypothetical protein
MEIDMSLMRSFQRTSVTVDHRAVPAYAITCNSCGKQDKLISSKPSGALPAIMVAKKFIERGWIAGARVRDDRCPACQAIDKAPKKKIETAQVIEMAQPQKDLPKEITILAEAPVVPAKRADPPPVMEKEDRRIIFAEIDTNYIDEQKGYAEGWNDARVAKGLNVPLAWVRELRDANFGPEIGTSVLDDVKKIDEVIERGKKFVARLDVLVELIDAKRAAIDKVYDEIKKDSGDAKAAIADLVKRVTDLNKRIS